ncbi:FliI/YscN family ATPase [Sphingomicrobium astaxanthinifaciens]|uniref:FliI/YscN family ATPase n=1 Tax=Sphingomicrobium astaxanthinifaciens TaxID=1227949 RepID=UPI001FCABC1B|nr:FliI/YscN family ATPase [Sphingomicrobium astaxanthinifaciens]MCJ7420364.1 FliI/YscN family ATPase [Sphingomicrobium astaxanthinifaciens]
MRTQTIEGLLDGICQSKPDFSPQRFGHVAACDSGLLEVSGLAIPVGAIARIDDGKGRQLAAEVVGFRNGRTLMMLLGDSVLLRPGMRVRPEGWPGMVRVGEANLGRAVDGLGHPIDGGAPLARQTLWPVGGQRHGALERTQVDEQFHSGIRAIDGLTTLGVGQRVGLIAGSGVGKSVLMDMIVAAASADVVVAGLIGERAREVSDFVAHHMEGEQKERLAVVAVPADHAPNLRLRGAMLATGLAEYFRSQGKRVLLVLDSLTRVAHASREIGLMLGEPVAARGYPPSALATITKLVERAGRSRSSNGSITGVYTVLADGDDTNDPVVDTARAILDGHIVLSRELAQRGHYPAIDATVSLSRVMDDIVGEDHSLMARELRGLIAHYESNRDLLLMGAYKAGADPRLDLAIAMRPKIEAFLTQARGQAVSPAEARGQLEQIFADVEG